MMKRILLFKLAIFSVILFNTIDGQGCSCFSNNSTLQCAITDTSSTLNVNSCNSIAYNSISIIYNGSVVLSLTSSSTKPIVVKPLDGSATHVLRILSMTTNAARIDIQINLSSNQAATTLLASSTITAPSSTLSINVIQNIPDANIFKVFDTPSSTQMNFANYELIFDPTSTSSGSLNLPNLIYGLKNLTSITISGNNHTLLVDRTQMPSSINVTQLSLKNLTLYNQILVNVYNLQSYSIQGCQFNQTSQFLYSDQGYNVSVEMKNNYPVNSVLPFPSDPFVKLGQLTSLTIIEPGLNSSFLKAIKKLMYPAKLLLQLGQYYQSDMISWANDKPIVWDLTIQNIGDLSIFPSLFLNKFYAITRATLQGTFNLDKSDICIFVGINIQSFATYPIVVLNSTQKGSNNWNNCAETYIRAINQNSMNNVQCLPDNTCQDCQQWANETAICDLVTYETSCLGYPIEKPGNNFLYNNSYLFNFFKQSYWLNSTAYPGGSPISKEDSINIGAIIGAVCGLFAAAIILGITVFCIYRRRQNDATKYISSNPAEKYTPSSNDQTHISIATSKSSKSSRYVLQKSFFPPMQPNDEIAPPLYTAPSESVGSVSNYNQPSAPSAPRDSISTRATHVYETVDS